MKWSIMAPYIKEVEERFKHNDGAELIGAVGRGKFCKMEHMMSDNHKIIIVLRIEGTLPLFIEHFFSFGIGKPSSIITGWPDKIKRR